LERRLAEVDKHVTEFVGKRDSSIEQRLAAIDQQLLKCTEVQADELKVRSCIEGAVKSQLEDDKQEEQEIEKRKTSVIIHGIAEPAADTSEERIENDLLQVAAMLEELKPSDVKVDKVIRLGKRMPDNTNEDEITSKPLAISPKL